MRLILLPLVAVLALPAAVLADPAAPEASAPVKAVPTQPTPATATPAQPTPAQPAPKKKQITLNDGVECHYEAPIGSMISKKVCTTKQVRDQGRRDAEESIINRSTLPTNN